MWGDYSTQRFWQFEQESWPRVLRDRGNLEKLVSYSKSMQQNNYGGIYLARWPYLVQCTWTNPGKCSPSSSASQLCKSLNKGQGGETFFSSLSQHPLWKQFFLNISHQHVYLQLKILHMKLCVAGIPAQRYCGRPRTKGRRLSSIWKLD